MKKLKNSELGRMSLEEYSKSEKLSIIVLLDNIRSMNNVGSVFRTCDAFSVEEVVICGITPCPPHRDIHKTALGATDSVKWTYKEDAIMALQEYKEKGYQSIGAEQTNNSILLHNYFPEKTNKYLLVFGNEIDGIQENLLPYLVCCLEIPQSGTKHSLNISVAAGIVIYHFYRNMKGS